MQDTITFKEMAQSIAVFIAVLIAFMIIFLIISVFIPNNSKSTIGWGLAIAVVFGIRKPWQYKWLKYRATYVGILFALPFLFVDGAHVQTKRDVIVQPKLATKEDSPKPALPEQEVQQVKQPPQLITPETKAAKPQEEKPKPRNVAEKSNRQLMPDGSEFLYNELDIKKVGWIFKGKESVKLRLKDPDSAKFRKLFFADKVAPVACGEVNSKNGLGGYTGYKRFVTGNREDLTFLETDVSYTEFKKVWKELCYN